MRLHTLRKDVTTAGVKERISGHTRSVARLRLWACPGNSDVVYAGDESVSAISGDENGIPIYPGDSSRWIELVNMNELWIDARASGDGVIVEWESVE